jgi:hypothetical protein
LCNPLGAAPPKRSTATGIDDAEKTRLLPSRLPKADIVEPIQKTKGLSPAAAGKKNGGFSGEEDQNRPQIGKRSYFDWELTTASAHRIIKL